MTRHHAIDLPAPARSHRALVAQPRLEVIRQDGAPFTHTPHTAALDWMVTVAVVSAAPLPFTAKPRCDELRPEPRYRVGWALVIAALAETIVAATAIATGAYAIGLVAVAAMASCGLLLVAAESVTIARGNDR